MDGDLRKIFHEHLDGHWQAVETGGTGKGIPDSNYCIDGYEGWVEFKHTKHWKVRIWPEQVAWMERRARQGGRVFIAVRRGQDELWILTPEAGRYLREGTLKDVPKEYIKARYNDGMKSWNWKEITKILIE